MSFIPFKPRYMTACIYTSFVDEKAEFPGGREQEMKPQFPRGWGGKVISGSI
jgi:hypothetical protein